MRNVFPTTKLQQEFEQKGYVIMPLLSTEEVSFVLSELRLMEPDDNFNPDGSSDRPSYHLTDLDTNLEYKQQAKKLISSVLKRHVERVFDEYKILDTNFIIKPPGKGQFSVHQDWTFVADPENYTSLTLWCPLVDTSENNGTLQVVEGSHKLVPDIATSTVAFYCKNIESKIVEKYSKHLSLKAGKCVIFDHSLLHFSGDNLTEQSRYVMQAIVLPAEINPVFYFYDRQAPEKGFEVFQIEPSFFIYENLFKRPSRAKSLGFVENTNKYLTEEEFSEKMKKSQQSREVGSKSLVLIKPDGHKRPFFYVHGADGHTVDAVLGKYIDVERPLYGIRAVGRDGQGVLHSCVQEMAAYYIQEIQTIQTEGPYLLGGRCTGGNIALEMAQQLTTQGQQVLLVVMVDSPRPLLTEEEKVEYLNAVVREEVNWRGKLKDGNFSPTNVNSSSKVFEYNLQIPVNHVPQVCTERVVYFSAQERSKDFFISDLLEPNAWNRWVANRVEIYKVPGDHLSMTKEPNVNVLAKELSNCLDRAECGEQNKEKLVSNCNINQEIQTKGYAVIDLLNEDEVKSLIDFDNNNFNPDETLAGITFSICTPDVLYRQKISQEIKKVFTPKLTNLFPNYRVAFGVIAHKRPDSSSGAMPLHQDNSLVDETSLESFGVWCPLVDVNEYNGCLQVVENSQTINSKFRPFFAFNFSPYSRDLLLTLSQNYLTPVPMKVGQALIYDKRLFHASSTNLTAFDRVAAIGVLVPKNSPVHFCYRDSKTSKTIEVFEVEDEFYDRYIVGQKPEGVKSLGIFDYEVEPLTPEILIEKLGMGNSAAKIPNWANDQVSFKPDFLEKLNPSTEKIAVLVSNEFEGFSKNGGIGTYYATLSQKLVADGWTVILLLCQTETEFKGEASFESVHHVFSTHETTQVLNLQPIHQQILSTTQQSDLGKSFDYQSFCCLFFLQALIATFPDAVVYAEFPEIWGFGYRTIQAKRSGLLGNSCLTGVTAHGSFEWLNEVNSKYSTEQANWFWQAHHYEQFSYENADVTYSPSHFLKFKLSGYGWKTAHAKHLPYFVPLINQGMRSPTSLRSRGSEQHQIVFFARLEERKGLCTFLEAIKLLDSTIASQIHLTFIGKIIPLQSSHLQHLNSQQYIDRELGNAFTYTLLSDLSSQEAIQAISDLSQPIVCLTSLQENFPNAALEMGQLPISLVVSDTGGFRETLELLQRSNAVYWFQPGNAHGLAQALMQAIRAYPENPTTIEQTAIKQINQQLLNQRLEFMSQAFLEAALKEPITPSVTIALIYWHSATMLLECLISLAAQTYEHLDVMVLSPTADESIQAAIAQVQTQFPGYKYLTSEANWSLGEAHNYLVDQSTGEYILVFSPDRIATPNLVEKLVTAAHEANAVAVVCPQLVALGEDLEVITLVDGNLLELLEFNHRHDLTALFSKTLLKEFRYSQERGLQALNWQIFAAAIATDQAIAYYPYPLYAIRPDSASTIPTANLAKERYYLRQYLFQIKPEQWNQRQINLLLTGFEQLVQAPSQSQRQNWQPVLPTNQLSSRQDQAWMITAQQMHNELTHAQARLKELENWNRELQTGKEWLESQWQSWMLRTQKLEGEKEEARSLIQQVQGSRFWKLRHLWLKLKRKLGRMGPDPLQPAAHTSTPGVQEFVARIAGQKIRFFQPAATQTPIVSIISSCFSEYEYLETTYRSIINQTLQNFEWIIVDDGSTHSETKALLTALPQRTAKIRIISHATHRGIAASYNSALRSSSPDGVIAEANGKYLCFIDIGSILDPTYLEKCVLFLETHSQVSVVNSYSIVFQAQEHWWHSHLNQPGSLLHQNGMMSHPVYRRVDFERLGGFDESAQEFADWERALKAISNGQKGWTIPEYLNCYRATNQNASTIAQHPDHQQTIETIHSRYQTFVANPPAIALEPQSLKLDSLNVKLNIKNQRTIPNPGKRILLFCDALDHSEVAKWNCDLVIWLERCGYDVTISTTSTSDHSCQEFFYQATPDILHLPNLFDRAYWLAFIRYILQARQIDSILISGSQIAYSFLPILWAEFPQIGLTDYSPANESTYALSPTHPSIQSLTCRLVASHRQVRDYTSFNSSISPTKIRICHTHADVEVALSELVRARQESVPTQIKSGQEALEVLLEDLQEPIVPHQSESIKTEVLAEPTVRQLLKMLLKKLVKK